MNILIVGSGGREHALAWKVSKSSRVGKVYVTPGNAGTAREPKVTNIAISSDDILGLMRFAKGYNIDLTIIGPEVPLVLGITDFFVNAGLRCFGPSKAAAKLEGSKTFMKEFLVRHSIPTARYQSFTNAKVAESFIRKMGTPIVIKADGLAAGKGVIIARSEQEAIDSVHCMLSGSDFGEAGRKIVIEEFLNGEEASFIVLTDGKHIIPFASSQDHKAVANGDIGPNTGGMGAYSPAPIITREMHDRIMTDIISPTVRGMAEENHHYFGFLYAGLMIGTDGPKVLEYNCRLGDPETQPLIMRLRSDLVELCEAAIDGRLCEFEINWDPRPALGVVMTAAGYPGSYRKGDVITGLPCDPRELASESKLFHSGTLETVSGEVVTNGGRVFCATALGSSISKAQTLAYELANRVHWDGVYYRTDIGYRAIERAI